MESTVSNIGFSHFIAQSDFLGKTILAILIGMSIVSWTLIIIKGIAGWRRKQYSNQFLHFFWNAKAHWTPCAMKSRHTASDVHFPT